MEDVRFKTPSDILVVADFFVAGVAFVALAGLAGASLARAGFELVEFVAGVFAALVGDVAIMNGAFFGIWG